MDFDKLENQLQNRRGVEPSAELRQRVILSANRQRDRQSSSLWYAAAAGLLIVVNLSMVVANQNSFDTHAGRNRAHTVNDLRSLRLAEAQLEGQLK